MLCFRITEVSPTHWGISVVSFAYPFEHDCDMLWQPRQGIVPLVL